MDKVGVVLLNCNGGKFTILCIRSLLSGAMKPDKIIVVDNASTDNSDKEIAVNFPQVQLIKNEINVGFSAGNNIGIGELIKQEYKYIWVLNNDTELDPGCLKLQYDFLENNPEISGCCGKILYTDSKKMIWYAGEKLKRFILRVRPRGMGEIDNGQYDFSEKITFMTGCSMFIRNRVWQKVGTFDEKFFIYYEDFDWSLRAEKLKCKLWYFPNAVIYHKVSATMGKPKGRQTPLVTPVKVTYLMQRNQIFVLKRWKNLISFLFIFFALEIPRALHYSILMLFSKRTDNFFALWKGIFDGLLDTGVSRYD